MQFNLFGKKFKCATCGKKFRSDTDLEKHRKTDHNI